MHEQLHSGPWYLQHVSEGFRAGRRARDPRACAGAVNETAKIKTEAAGLKRINSLSYKIAGLTLEHPAIVWSGPIS